MMAHITSDGYRVVVTLANGMTVAYTKPEVQLIGEEGNAFAILNKVKKYFTKLIL